MFIGIGSNIDSEENLRKAGKELRRQFPDVIFSSIFSSAPMYNTGQDDYLNAVARAQTELTAEEVFEELQNIERLLGKHVTEKNGPRTIDLDLLLYSDERINNERINVPHERLHERRFVLEPLCELVGLSEEHPVLKQSWGSLLEKTLQQDCTRTDFTL